MDSQFLILIFQLAVLVFSVMVHEVAHGIMALRLGDTTAKDAGRLTLNPIKHIDLFGSIILPLALSIPALFGQPTFIIGWAKPVPINPNNLKDPKRGAGIIAAVGPLSNILIASVFGLFLQLVLPIFNLPITANLAVLFQRIIGLNVILAVFNLVPLPPLDGSNILFALLPERFRVIREFLLRYGFWLLILFIFFGFQLIIPIVDWLYRLLVGSAALL